MPRIRTIKPEITTDEKLARVSRDARLTFIYAITQADDDGLLAGNPRQLLAALFPTDESVTDRILASWVSELVGIGVCRWRRTKQGAPVLEITNWANHQRVDHKGKSLLLPHLQDWSEVDAGDSRESRETVANVSRSDLGPGTKDLRPFVPSADGTRETDYSPEFEATWLIYPRRAGGNSKREAYAAWRARIRSGVPAAVLHAGVERYAAFVAAEGNVGTKYVKQAAAFFGPGDHYLEPWEIAPPVAAPTNGRPRVLAATEMLIA